MINYIENLLKYNDQFNEWYECQSYTMRLSILGGSIISAIILLIWLLATGYIFFAIGIGLLVVDCVLINWGFIDNDLSIGVFGILAWFCAIALIFFWVIL